MKKLTAEQLEGRVLYAGKLRTPRQVEAVRKYQREWARRNPGKKHTWRNANPDKARESARLSMAKLRAAEPKKFRDRSRVASGYPLPTRPEPMTCEICGRACRSGKALHLDHDHTTGKFRGWLCDLHNRGLGYFQDDPQLLRKAARYLVANAREVNK